jgi:hypothetical protein
VKKSVKEARQFKARRGPGLLLFVMASLTVCPAMAQRFDADRSAPWWVDVGVGGATIESPVAAPATDRGGLAASLDFGFRFTPHWGLGLEFGAVAPSHGCAAWQCEVSAPEFAPAFTRIFAVSEFRPGRSGWRLRAGAGVSRYCYRAHWSESAWSWTDTVDMALLLLGDGPLDGRIGGSGGYLCDAHKNALGGTVSVGYDWRVSTRAPVSMGLRLSAEAAGFSAEGPVGLPAFRHRAIMLTLHLKLD